MANSTYQSLVSALTGEYPGFRESELPTSRDLLDAIYNPSTREDLITRLINPLKDELLQKSAADRALLTRSAETSRFV